MAHPLDELLCRGAALHDSGHLEQALELYDRAIADHPRSAALWNNRGNTLLELSRRDAALESYRRTLELVPGLHDARVAMATCLQALGEYAAALRECEQVLAAAPDHAEAHWNRSLLLLLSGRYAEGWPEYEWRWRKRRFTSPQRTFARPLWQGEEISGTSLLVHAEQGFGDTLQFCRYLTLLADRGASVHFECHPQLVRLTAGMDSRVNVLPFGAALPPFDRHIPLLSLPLLFGTTLDSIPERIPYLAPPARCLPFWESLVPADGTFRVGICWAGKSYPDPARSCPPGLLAPLASIPGVRFYSLQMGHDGPPPFPGIIDLTSQLLDFADTAALMSMLDLIVTIDTAVAHAAGAIGREAWIMLPFSPDWRWLLDRSDSPWYPQMRLFRQKSPGAWGDVIAQVAEALRTRSPGSAGTCT